MVYIANLAVADHEHVPANITSDVLQVCACLARLHQEASGSQEYGRCFPHKAAAGPRATPTACLVQP